MDRLDPASLSRLSKDVIIYMALNLDLPEILKLCQTSRRFNKTVCKNRDFWSNKLQRDFNIDPALLRGRTNLKEIDPALLRRRTNLKEIYQLLSTRNKTNFKEYYNSLIRITRDLFYYNARYEFADGGYIDKNNAKEYMTL